MAMNVNFLKGLYSKYTNLVSKDPNTFYLTYETGTNEAMGGAVRLFLGEEELTNKVDIEALREYIGTLPENATSDNIVSYISEALTAKIGELKIGETTYSTVVEYVTAKTSGIATDATVAGKADKVDGATAGNLAGLNADGNLVDSRVSAESILADAKAYVDEEDKFDGDVATVNALGGIPANTVLKNKTTHEILDMLLFPYVQPVVATPTRTPNTTSALEKGDTQTVTQVSVKVTKKSKPITKVELYQGNTLIATKEGNSLPSITSSGTTVTFTGLSVSVPSTNVTFTVKVTDESGKTVTSSATANWSFVYPYYYGICAGNKTAATLTEADIEGMTKDIKTKGEKSYTYTTDNQKMVIAYPKAHGVLKNALDPNGFNYIGDYEYAELSITGLDGSAQAYYVYAQKAPSFVTSFTMKYQY